MAKMVTCESGGMLTFRGASDDTFCCYGVANIEDDDCARGLTREFTVRQPDGSGFIVRGRYGALEAGVWLIGVAPLDEDKPLGSCMTMYQDGYTMRLLADVVAGTTITVRRIPHKAK